MYNPKDIQFVGKHDYDKEQALNYARTDHFKTFSIGIFKWEFKKSGNSMKRGKCVVRIKANTKKQDEAFETAERIVKYLDSGLDVAKTITIK